MKEERYSGNAWLRIWKEKGESEEEMEDRLGKALAKLETEYGIKITVNVKPDSQVYS